MDAKVCGKNQILLNGKCISKTKMKYVVVAVTTDINEAGNYYPIIDESVRLKPRIFNNYPKAIDYSDELFEKGMATDTLVIPVEK